MGKIFFGYKVMGKGHQVFKNGGGNLQVFTGVPDQVIDKLIKGQMQVASKKVLKDFAPCPKLRQKDDFKVEVLGAAAKGIQHFVVFFTHEPVHHPVI